MVVWLITAVRRFDLAMAGICAMLVGGFIFMGFGLAAYLFLTSSVALTFWFLGLGLWLFALAIFCFFMDHPLPKHRKRR